MKKSWLFSAVVAGHGLVLTAVLMQGCATRPAAGRPPEPKLPAPVMEPAAPPTHPIRPAPMATPEVKSWSSDTTPYTVQKGDSLSLICQRFGVSKAEVMALNHMKDPNKVLVGKTMLLPGKVDLKSPPPPPPVKRAAPAKAPAKVAKPAAATAAAGEYIVQPGDSLSKIAVRHKTTVKALREANNLKSDSIRSGQKLKVAGAAASAAPAAPAPAPAPVAVEAAAPAAPAPAPAAEAAPAAVETPPVPPAAATESVDASSPSFRQHTVEAGEDLYHVSLMWDVSVEELQRLNSITGTALTPGQVLKIPMTE